MKNRLGILAEVKRKDLTQKANILPEAHRYYFNYHYFYITC